MMLRLLPLLALAPLLAAATSSYTINVTVQPAGTIVMAPTIEQPTQTGDIVGLNIQGTGSARYLTIGEPFAKGAVQSGDSIVVRQAGGTMQAQLDTLAVWSDGSVKLGAITFDASPGAAMIAKGSVASPLTGTPTLAPTLTVTLPSGTTDLGALLPASTDCWLSGPLAKQCRVDVPVSGSLHVTADVTAYVDGTTAADVSFNNDIAKTVQQAGFSAQQAQPTPLSYTAVIALNGVSRTDVIDSQYLYQDWIARFGAPTWNVQHDPVYLTTTGLVLPYDLSLGVKESIIQARMGTILSDPLFGKPLAMNGVTAYMPTTGGRPDIGWLTFYGTVWIITQDQRAAAVAMAQADTDGSIPWNFRGSDGHWLSNATDPTITSLRGQSDSLAYSPSLPGWSPGSGPAWSDPHQSQWVPSLNHQPELAYLPYLMTGERWYLDRLNAQATSSILGVWIGVRCLNSQSLCDNLVTDTEVRQASWGIRQVGLAAAIGRPGTFEISYFTRVLADNYAWAVAYEPKSYDSASGNAVAFGWMPQGNAPFIGPWQEDYFSGVTAWMARATENADAVSWLQFGKTWMTQRFISTDPGWNPLDGCTTYITVATTGGSPDNHGYFDTWGEIQAATAAAGKDITNVSDCYSQGARGALAAVMWLFPGDADYLAAYQWITNKAALAGSSVYQTDPTWNVRAP